MVQTTEKQIRNETAIIQYGCIHHNTKPAYHTLCFHNILQVCFSEEFRCFLSMAAEWFPLVTDLSGTEFKPWELLEEKKRDAVKRVKKIDGWWMDGWRHSHYLSILTYEIILELKKGKKTQLQTKQKASKLATA